MNSITRSVMPTKESNVMNQIQPLIPFHLFDREADVHIIDRRLPHWGQAGTVCFITWRTHDSMPNLVLDQWYGDRNKWLREQGIDSTYPDWRDRLHRLDLVLVQEFFAHFWNRWHDALDIGHGACVLRQPNLATIVEKSLRHFDGERYFLLDFVIMPNHVHLLASFPDESAMLKQCESWKHYTATQINRRLHQKGRFWQQDGFDHLVRSEEQFRYLREYIAANPKKAGIKPGEFVHYSVSLS
jgi:putative transposase